MVTEHIFDFEWRPLQNYLRDRDIAIPPFAAEQESRSDALYNWIVSKGYSGKEGLNLGTYYHISDYGVIGLALLCAENVGDILKVIRAYVKLFNRDIANVGVKPRENYEVEIHISVNFKPEWNDASRQFHVNVIASATYKLIMDLLGNDFPISALTVPVHGADKTIYEGFFSLPVKHEGNDIIFSFPAHQLNRTLWCLAVALCIDAGRLRAHAWTAFGFLRSASGTSGFSCRSRSRLHDYGISAGLMGALYRPTRVRRHGRNRSCSSLNHCRFDGGRFSRTLVRLHGGLLWGGHDCRASTWWHARWYLCSCPVYRRRPSQRVRVPACLHFPQGDSSQPWRDRKAGSHQTIRSVTAG